MGQPQLGITKSVSNIMLGGIQITRPVPGATAIYMISYSNAGNATADNAVIYDAIPVNTVYNTNYMIAPGWTAQYSTNVDPSQNYNSSDYSDTYTTKTNIKWVRWKNASVAIGENGVFIYKVIIK